MIDVVRYPWHDVTRIACAQELVGWIRRKIVHGVMVAFPCTTWSRARWPALRTSEYLLGKPHLNESERAQVELGNKTFGFTCRIVKAAISSLTPCLCENPVASMAWSALPMKDLVLQGVAMNTDFCQYGARWRKRTKLVGWNMVSQHGGLDHLCSAGVVCSLSGLPHVVLRGKQGIVNWTKISQAYPTRLARLLAAWLLRSVDVKEYRRLLKACGPDH